MWWLERRVAGASQTSWSSRLSSQAWAAHAGSCSWASALGSTGGGRRGKAWATTQVRSHASCPRVRRSLEMHHWYGSASNETRILFVLARNSFECKVKLFLARKTLLFHTPERKEMHGKLDCIVMSTRNRNDYFSSALSISLFKAVVLVSTYNCMRLVLNQIRQLWPMRPYSRALHDYLCASALNTIPSKPALSFRNETPSRHAAY